MGSARPRPGVRRTRRPATLVDVAADGVARRRRLEVEVEVVVATWTDEAATRRAVGAAVGAFGRLDVLVNVVGGSAPGKNRLELGLDEWNTLLASPHEHVPHVPSALRTSWRRRVRSSTCRRVRGSEG